MCLVAPAGDEWCIARREDERGWFSADGSHIDEPLVYAPLPPAPGRHGPRMIKSLVAWVVDSIDDGDYAAAARAIDELADAVREMRDSPLERLAG